MLKEKLGKITNRVLEILVGPPVWVRPPQARDRHGRFAKH
jgi:hypothetical protein